MNLKQIYEALLIEQETQTLDLPQYNLVVSLFEKEKKFSFNPLEPSKPASKSRMLINQLKQKFKVLDVQQEMGNSFQVTLDPRQDFWVVVDFLQNV